jgi:hypothetical protein
MNKKIRRNHKMRKGQTMKSKSQVHRKQKIELSICAISVLLGLTASGFTQNVAIYSWMPEGTVKSEDVCIRPAGAVMGDFFDPGTPENISLIKSANAIYARFHNNSSVIIPNGAVTVTAAYAEAGPGLDPGALVAAASAITGWKTIGSYTMNLEIPPGSPPGYGLLWGASYPTSNEVNLPDRYRILCSSDCSQPLPTSFFLRVTLSMTGDTNPGDNIAYSYYDLTGGTPSADVVVLHDVSGSMYGNLSWAKQRARMFVDIMNAGDRIGVVAFSTQFTGNTHVNATLNPIMTVENSDAAKTFAKNGINSFSAGGLTPMGSGVLKAQEVLNGAMFPSTNRAIVMFTDGMENQLPYLKDPLHNYPILEGLNHDLKGPIALFPIWFGTMSNWGKSLLEDIITHVDRGKVVDQPDDDLALAKAYLMIRGILTHDDVYAIHEGTSNDGYVGAIDVDRMTDELLLVCAWSTFGRQLALEVLPSGFVTWQNARAKAASVSSDSLYVVYRFIQPERGPWKYRIARPQQTATRLEVSEKCVLAAMADKVDVLMQSFLADQRVTAGNPIVMKARLTQGGAAVKGAVVEATVASPFQSFGTLLYVNREKIRIPAGINLQADQGKAKGILEQLRAALGRDNPIQYQSRKIRLTDPDGDGVYTGRVDQTRVAGTYKINITAQGEGFRRQHSHAAMVAFAAIDPGKSKVEVVKSDSVIAGMKSVWRVRVIPVDIYGNYLDPGYADKVKMEATGGRWIRDLVDDADGCYTRILGLAEGQEAKVKVSAFGRSIKNAIPVKSIRK